jgi:hypothetical protein
MKTGAERAKRQAVLTERERCAKIADDNAEAYRHLAEKTERAGGSDGYLQLCRARIWVSQDIAAAIRCDPVKVLRSQKKPGGRR